MHANVASAIMTVALFVFMLIQPLIGALSDKIGRRTSMLIFGGMSALCTVPILTALQHVSFTVCRLWSGHAGDGHCQFLHIDQWDPEG